MDKKSDDCIYITSNVNEIFASTELIQYFTNPLENPIELTILFPIKEELSLSKFVVSIDNQIVLSKVMPKEKAAEKYSDTIASGNVGFMSKYEEDNKSYSVNIGNLKPKQQIKLDSIFMQMIGSQDISYEFSIMDNYPSFYYKEAKNDDSPKYKKIFANIQIQTQSKITRLIAPFYDKKYKNDLNSIFNVKYGPDYKSAKIIFIKDQADIIKIDKKDENGEKPTFYSTFCILFRTENMNKPLLCSQYNPEFKETAFSINYIYTSKNLKEIPIPEKPDEDNTISYTAKDEENITNETPGLFVFLIDQSGSMSGKPIELVKKALLLFIQSLPEQSYFQLIGFGSDFKKYNEEPVIYNKENVNNIINIINGLSADLGGTNISGPLSEIYNNECYSKINLSRNIFLLTDGEVFDREKCIEIISANSSKFRLHSLGIGNDFDKQLIEQCGKLGKGSSSFVRDLEKIDEVVIDVLNKGLRPYITDIQFDFENYKDEISSNIIKVNPTNNFTYQNEVMNYSFILPGKQELSDMKVKITGKDPINLIEADVTFNNPIKLNDGEELSKVIIGRALKNNEELTKNEENEVKFAKKYQILSKNTALFAEILNDENQQSKLIKVNLTASNERSEVMRMNNIMINNNSCNSSNSSPLFGFSSGFKSMSNFNMNMNPMMGMMCNMNNYNNNQMYNMNLNNNNNNFMFNNQMNCMNMNNLNFASQNNMNMNMCNSMNPMFSSQHQMMQQMMQPQMMMQQAMQSQSIKSVERNKYSDMNIIMCQDALEGFWDENEETKKIIDIISLDKFNKIKNKVIALNKGKNEIKIIFTILVVYYLKTNLSSKLNEYKLVINKAYKFLRENGIDYDVIVTGI